MIAACIFAFSLGKAFEDQKDYDQAFEHYALANQLHRDTIATILSRPAWLTDGCAKRSARDFLLSEVLNGDVQTLIPFSSLGCPDQDQRCSSRFWRATRKLMAPVSYPIFR